MTYQKSELGWKYNVNRCWLNLTNFILGCLSSYVPECIDRSDVFVCPAKTCENDTRFFQCKDRRYCIYQNLVCDGYSQCEDGSGIIQDIFDIYSILN